MRGPVRTLGALPPISPASTAPTPVDLPDTCSLRGPWLLNRSSSRASEVTTQSARMPSQSAPSVAFVTGGTGFVGSHLVEALVAQGVGDVRCLVRGDAKWLGRVSGPVTTVSRRPFADERSARRSQAWTAVYHVAGLTRARDQATLDRANVAGTRSLLAAVREAAPGARGRRHEQPRSDGSQPRRARRHAGPGDRGRHAAPDLDVRPLQGSDGAHGPHEFADLRPTVVRPPAVYGPREADIFEMIRAASRGVFAVVGDGRGRRLSLVHVRDLVAGMVLAASAPGETFFVGSHRGYSWNEVRAAMAAALGRRVWRLPVPTAAMGLAGRVSEGVGALRGTLPPLTRDKAEAARHAWVCSNASAEARLGYRPRVGLAEGMAETVAWARSRGLAVSDADARSVRPQIRSRLSPRCVGPMPVLWQSAGSAVRTHQLAAAAVSAPHHRRPVRPPRCPDFYPRGPRRRAPVRSPPRRSPPSARPAGRRRARVTALASRLTLTPAQQARLVGRRRALRRPDRRRPRVGRRVRDRRRSSRPSRSPPSAATHGARAEAPPRAAGGRAGARPDGAPAPRRRARRAAPGRRLNRAADPARSRRGDARRPRGVRPRAEALRAQRRRRARSRPLSSRRSRARSAPRSRRASTPRARPSSAGRRRDAHAPRGRRGRPDPRARPDRPAAGRARRAPRRARPSRAAGSRRRPPERCRAAGADGGPPRRARGDADARWRQILTPQQRATMAVHAALAGPGGARPPRRAPRREPPRA